MKATGRLRGMAFSCMRKDAVATLVFLAAFLVLLLVSYSFVARLGTVFTSGYFFGNDSERVARDLMEVNADHYRVKVHPLFLMVGQTLFHLTNAFVVSDVLAVAVLEALVSSMGVLLLWLTAYRLTESLTSATLCAAMYVLSFSTLLFCAMPETFAFGGTSVIAVWYAVVRMAFARAGGMTGKEGALLVAIGVLSASITITNVLQFAVALAFFFHARGVGLKGAAVRYAGILLAAASALAVLVFCQNAVWPGTVAFYDVLLGKVENEEVLYISFSVGPEVLASVARVFFLQSVFAPRVRYDGHWELSGYGPIHFAVLFGFAVLFVVALAVVMRRGLIGRVWKGNGGAFAFLLLALLLNLALHVVYGASETLLFSQHWVFLLMLAGCLLFDRARAETRLGDGLLAVSGALAVVAGVSNVATMAYLFRVGRHTFGEPLWGFADVAVVCSLFLLVAALAFAALLLKGGRLEGKAFLAVVSVALACMLLLSTKYAALDLPVDYGARSEGLTCEGPY